MNRDVYWTPLDGPGLEHCRLMGAGDVIVADSQSLRVFDGEAMRLTYTLRMNAAWCVTDLALGIEGKGAWHLQSDGNGHWTTGGKAIADLDGCIDVDISITPFTNTLPIRRLDLAVGASQEFRVVYVKLPDMTLQAVGQRYTCLEKSDTGGRYRYEGLTTGAIADLAVDADGLVLDYPDAFKRAWSAETATAE